MIKIDELKEKFGKLSVLVVGDICLDVDYIGGYSGYSREVEQLPIFRAETVKYSPGGGGNLAMCFATLGVKTAVAGYMGDIHDPNRNHLLLSFHEKNIDPRGIVTGLRTPVFQKSYLHNGQHIYRLDVVSELPNDHYIDYLKDSILNCIEEYDFVACADYEEVHEFGVCSPEVIDAVRQNAKVKFATSRQKMDWFHGFDYIIQNRKEYMQSKIHLSDLATRQLIITLGGKGASVYPSGKLDESEDIHVPSKELTENVDPCGCGDMFYAIYASSVMADYDTTTCLQLANAGARCVARKLFGTGQADCEEIAKEWNYLYGSSV